MNELLKTPKLEEFYYSNFEFRWFVAFRNSNSIKLEMPEIFEPKFGKLVSKLKLKFEKLIFF